MKIIFDKGGQPDPYIIQADGKFYIYASGDVGVKCFGADRLDGEWKNLGIALKTPGQRDYWAPCVIEIDGKYYMYYSSVSDDSKTSHDERVKVAVSDRPDGGFEYVCDMLPPFSIDPHVVMSGGKLYMFYSLNNYDKGKIGTYIAVVAMSSPTAVSGESVPVVTPSIDEEIFMRNRYGDGKDWYTLEGAFYFRDGDAHYLIYSGNCYGGPNYFLGYSSAITTENDLTKIKYAKQPSADVYAPLIAANGFESGTGHCSVIRIDGKYYCVYHGRDLCDEGKEGETRSARACALEANNGTLTAKRYPDKL